MIITRFPIILCLLMRVTDAPNEYILHFPIEKENCHLNIDYIVCNNLHQIQPSGSSKLSLYSLKTPFLSGLKFSNQKNRSKLSVLNLEKDLSIQFKTLLNNIYLNNYQGLLCLNRDCSFTTKIEIYIISRYKHNIEMSDVHLGKETQSLNKHNTVQNIQATFANIKRILLDYKTSSHLKFNMTNDILYELDSYLKNLQNSDLKSANSFIERTNKNNMESMFHAFVFLMLFAVVLLFNIYYCGSIMYCIYTDKRNVIDY